VGKSYRESKSRERRREVDMLPKRNLHRKLIDDEREEETRNHKLKSVWRNLLEEIKLDG